MERGLANGSSSLTQAALSDQFLLWERQSIDPISSAQVSNNKLNGDEIAEALTSEAAFTIATDKNL